MFTSPVGLTQDFSCCRTMNAVPQLTDIQQQTNPDKKGRLFEGWYFVHNTDKVKLQLNVSDGTHRSLQQQRVVWVAEVANQRHPRTVPGWWLKPLVASGAPTVPSVCYHTARLPVSRTQTAAGWRVWIRYAAHLLQIPRNNDKFKLHVAVIKKRGIQTVSTISRHLSIDRMNGLKFIWQKSCVTSCCLG